MKNFRSTITTGLVWVLFGLLICGFTGISAAADKGTAAVKIKKEKVVAKKTAKKPVPNKEVAEVQKALNKSGYKLSVDGYMGPKTRDALKKYQKKQGLKVSGKVDPATLAKLGIQ